MNWEVPVNLVQQRGPSPWRSWYFTDFSNKRLMVGLFVSEEAAIEYAISRQWRVEVVLPLKQKTS